MRLGQGDPAPGEGGAIALAEVREFEGGPKYLQRFLSRQKKEDARQEQRNLQRPLEGR